MCGTYLHNCWEGISIPWSPWEKSNLKCWCVLVGYGRYQQLGCRASKSWMMNKNVAWATRQTWQSDVVNLFIKKRKKEKNRNSGLQKIGAKNLTQNQIAWPFSQNHGQSPGQGTARLESHCPNASVADAKSLALLVAHRTSWWIPRSSYMEHLSPPERQNGRDVKLGLPKVCEIKGKNLAASTETKSYETLSHQVTCKE